MFVERLKLIKMEKITKENQMSFRQIYNDLPGRASVKCPKTRFVERIAEITMKSTKTVRCWLAGTQYPDALSTSMIEKELGVPGEYLFPKADD